MQQQTETLTEHLARLWREGTEGSPELYHRRYYADGIAWASGTGRLGPRAEDYLESLSYEDLEEMVDGWHVTSMFTAQGRSRFFSQNDVPRYLNNLEEHLQAKLEVAVSAHERLLDEHEMIGQEMSGFNAPSELSATAYKPCEEALEKKETEIRGLHEKIKAFTGEHPDPHFFCPGCEVCADLGEED